MLKYFFPILFFGLGIWLSISLNSCMHEPILDDVPINPVDTTNNPPDTSTIDTTMTDTTMTGIPCDPDIIYFDKDVLPILQSNCAFSGCHDTATAQDGVILESFEDVIQSGEVEPFDLNESDLYKVLIENDPDDRMPPPPSSPISQNQITIIAEWILQGAQDLECDPNAAGCDTDNVSYSEFVKPLLQNNCQGCHSGTQSSGGIELTTYDGAKAVANNGSLLGAIDHQSGFSPMPQGAAKLNDCDIDKIKSWIDAGTQNN